MSRITNAPVQAEPTWDIAQLFPSQGDWSEEEYLGLETNRLVELSDGILEILPMPTTLHQWLVLFLAEALQGWTRHGELGMVLLAPLRIRLWQGKFREPDVVFMLKEHADGVGERFWKGADLVMEVLSHDKKDRHRDLDVKRREYARAGIREYWIVDPEKERILVLRLSKKRYVVHGKFDRGTMAKSHLLAGFSVDAGAAFSQRSKSSNGRRKTRKR